ncbi:MAG TPA: CoA transferase [Rhodopila sp.]|uniref:CaiB/BaiF CoA transferase family protein n=1 Tax=Rhodopila sp. TaxID=2480087 RepID=UPI002C77EC9A|nr:CoA transferase [Rhodopila sp.]HVY16409.1 CoA transferase [Rhodopila sp.]
MPGALDHLLVLDLTSHLSGPYCAMMLADHGADVIKIEPPAGDSARNMPPFVNGESAPFMTWNRNKRSVVMDFKKQADRMAFLQLVDKADVVVENYRPGVMDRLGIGWDVLHARNPRLILASISGFGQTGPYSSRGGFDLITQAMSGLMSTNGPADGPPFRLPIAISDVTAGMFLAFGVMTALEARHRTGEGQRVETSLFEAATSLAVYESAHYFATGTRPERIGQAHRGSAPYQCFQTADGYITLGASQQKFFEGLAKLVELPSLLEDERFRTNALRVQNNDALVALLQAKIAGKPSAFWLAELEKLGIPAGPVQSYDEVFNDPQILARDMVAETRHPVTGPFKTMGVPVKLSATPGAVRGPAPRLGEHTDAILNQREAAE